MTTETLLTEQIKIANSEFLKLTGLGALILAVLIILILVKFSKEMWVARVNHKDNLEKKLKTARIWVVCACVVAMVAALWIVKVYKKPYCVSKTMSAYNLNHIGRKESEKNDEPGTSNIEATFIVSRKLFTPAEVRGIAVVDGVEYIGYIGHESEDSDGEYYVHFAISPTFTLLDKPEIMLTAYDEFEVIQYSVKRDGNWQAFIGPAVSSEEVEALINR